MYVKYIPKYSYGEGKHQYKQVQLKKSLLYQKFTQVKLKNAV